MRRALLCSILIHGFMLVFIRQKMHSGSLRNYIPLDLQFVSESVRSQGLKMLQKNKFKKSNIFNLQNEFTAHDSLKKVEKNTEKNTDMSGIQKFNLDLYIENVLQVNPHPSYPKLAKMNKEAGVVQVEVRILQTGQLTSASIASSSGSDILDQHSLKALRNWVFPPFLSHQKEVVFIVPVRYELKL